MQFFFNCTIVFLYFSFTSHGHVVHAFSFIGFRRRQRGYFHGNHWSCGLYTPDSLLSSSFSSRFFYFGIFSLSLFFFYIDERPRNDRQAGKNFTMKHPIKNAIRNVYSRSQKREIFLAKCIHESKCFIIEKDREREILLRQQLVFKTRGE